MRAGVFMVAEKDKKEEMAMDLVRSHTNVDQKIRAIYRLIGPNEDSEDEPVKLLEVNEETVEAGIEPIYFGPYPKSGLPCPSVIVDITPREFELVLNGELPLPHSWKLGHKLAS